MPFLDSLDIANRAVQLCGGQEILSVTEDSSTNAILSAAYDKLRRPELQRNTWRFAIRTVVLRAIDTTTRFLSPNTYDATKTYLPGAVVRDANGQLWISIEPDNINNTPGDTDVWDMYFGPLTVSLWDAATTYLAGEVVYKLTSIAGQYVVYLSLENVNDDIPSTATAWLVTVTYGEDAVVSSGGFQWRSLLPVNKGVTPAVGPAAFDIATTYSIAQTVTASDDFIYSSVGNGNVGNDPTTDAGVHWTNTNVPTAWSRLPVIPVSSQKWLVLQAVVKSIPFLYPINAGPSSQATTKNVFRLPSGYLKQAPQDPKAGAVSSLGAPGARAYDDWNLQGNYLVSADVGPLLFRFVADVTKVSAMDDMFCEGLACRVADGVCERLTQSTAKVGQLAARYKWAMGEARLANAIELGPVEPPEDDFIECRK